MGGWKERSQSQTLYIVSNMWIRFMESRHCKIRLADADSWPPRSSLLQDHIASSQASAGYTPDGPPPPACFPPGWQQHHPPHRVRARMQVVTALSAGSAGSAAEMLNGRGGIAVDAGGRTFPPAALAVVTELALEGDGGFWLSHIITPVFLLLAQEVWDIK